MQPTTNGKLDKKPFDPSPHQVALILSHIFPKYYKLIQIVNSRYRTRDRLKPTNITYLLLLYAYPDGLTVSEIMEIMCKPSTPHLTLNHLMSLGYIERTKGRKRGGYNMTPDIYHLSLSGVAVVESLLNAIKR